MSGLELRRQARKQGYAGGNVETGDRVIRDVVQIFDEGAQAVAMGGERLSALSDCRRDRLVPVGEDPATVSVRLSVRGSSSG